MPLSRAAAGSGHPPLARTARLFLLLIIIVGAVGIGVVPVPSQAQTDLGNRVGRVVAENQPAGTLVGSPVALTGLVGAVTYELGGSDADSFSIDSASGQLRTNGLLDFEEQRRYEVTVTVTDDNGSTEVEVWINVTDLEEPGEMSAGPASLRAGTIIRARLTDPDGGVDRSLVIWRWEVSDDGVNFTQVAAGISGEAPGKGAEAAAFTPAAEHAGKFLRVRAAYADRRSPNGQSWDKSAEWVSGTRIAAGSTPPALTVRPLLSELTIPWDVAFTPDGTMLVTERGGRLLSRFPDGRVQEVSADFRDVYSNIYVGLMGLAVDPDFETNRRFYTCQAHTGVRVEVIAWTMAGDYSTATRVADPLVGGIGFAQFPRHGGCRVRIGPDGYLWITTGDGDSHTSAQNLNSLNGKVLRVDSQTGQGAPDNPFNSRVYTYGHRNPQGLAFRPGTNQVWTVEHGPSYDDEINLLASGGNYGWDPAGPLYSENVPMTDLKAFPDAVEAKWHSGFPAIATSGAAFLDGSGWGEWNGRLAVAQLKQQELKVFEFSADGTLLSEILVPELDQVYGRLRSPVLGPDGALYVTTSNGSGSDHVLQVYGPSSPRLSGPSAVEYREGDTQPVATFTSHNLDGSVSWTLDGQDASAFRITASGELHFRTPPQFHASTDANSDNVYHAAVKADNGTSSAQIGVAVSVARTTTQEPEMSIAASAGIIEGGDAVFTLTAVPAPSAALDVTVAVAQSGDFGVSPGSHTVTVPTTGTAVLTVATANDSTDEADGSVTATIGTGSGYTISATAGAATIAVADDDVTAPVCVPSLPSDAVTVSEVTGWRDGHSGAAHVKRWNRVLAALGADTGEAPMTVKQSRANESQFIPSRWDRVTRTLEAIAQCDDNDPAPPPPVVDPEISITAGADIDEGGDAVFTVSADPVPSAALDVTVAVTAAGDFGVSPGSRTVTVPTAGSATLTVATANDSTDEADGSVTAAVGAGSGYEVSATAGSATVAVADDDVPAPVGDGCVVALSGDGSVSGVWAAGCGSSARAGRYARFYSFSLDASSRVTVDLVSSVDTYLYLRRGSGQKSGAALVFNDDGGDGYNSRISRSLAAGGYTIEATTYRSSEAGPFTLTVAGIPAQTVAPPKPEPEPEVSIAAGAGIDEGSGATFTVTADPAPAAPLAVTVEITQAGDYGVTPGSRTVTVPTAGSATLTVATANDSTDEADGAITATIGASIGYTVSTTSGSATVAVSDDDPALPPPAAPEVSIAAGAGVTEGGDAVFTVTSDPVPSEALDVTVAVTAAGDFGVSPGSHTITIPTSGSATLTVATTGDSSDEADGSVTATVSAGSGYTVSTTAGAATVAIADDDNPPPPPPPPPPPASKPSISVDDATAAEGDGAVEFTVRLSGASTAAVTVYYAANPGTAMPYADYRPDWGQITFAPGDTSKTIQVSLIDDRTPGEGDETFVLKLILTDTTHATLADNQAQGTITDND